MTSPAPTPQPAPTPRSRPTGAPGTTTTRTTTTQVARTQPRLSKPVWILFGLLGLAVEATVMTLFDPVAGAVLPAAAGAGYVAYRRRKREQQKQAKGGRQAQARSGQTQRRGSLRDWLFGRSRGRPSSARSPGASRPSGASRSGSGRGRLGNPLRGLFGGGKGRSSGSGRSGAGRSGSGSGRSGGKGGLPKLGNPFKGLFGGGGSGRSGGGSGGSKGGGKGGGKGGLPKLGNPFKGLFGGGGSGRSGSGGSRTGGRAGGRTGSGSRGRGSGLRGLLGGLFGGRGRGGAGSGGSRTGGRAGGRTSGRTPHGFATAARRVGRVLGRTSPGGGTSGGSGTAGSRLPLRLQASRRIRLAGVRWRAFRRTPTARAIAGGARRGVAAGGVLQRAFLPWLNSPRTRAWWARTRSNGWWAWARLRARSVGWRARWGGRWQKPAPLLVSLVRQTPKRRRPTAPPATLASAFTSSPSGVGASAGTGRTTSVARAFEALIEEIHQTASRWEPTNENGAAAANEMRQMIADAPAVFEAFAQMWTTMAAKCTDQIWLEAGAADALNQAAAYCRKPADDLRETAAVVDRPHGADLEALQRGPTQQAWSWADNQGYAV